MKHDNHALLLMAVIAACFAVTARADEPKPVHQPIASMLGTEAGQVRDDNWLKMKFVWCPRGVVTMEHVERDADGLIINTNTVNVFVGQGYWLGKFEVTQAEWKQVLASEPWKGRNRTKEGDEFPACWVSFDDAMKFCERLTDRERDAGRLPEGWLYTLPTEAQWERACRARTETKYSFGDDESKLGEYGWYVENSGDAGESYAHPVGRKMPNPWGFHDMHGNLWEWCRDSYFEKLPGGRDPEIIEPDSERALRGGGWRYFASGCRSASRRGSEPANQFMDIGFRVALTPVRQAAENLPK